MKLSRSDDAILKGVAVVLKEELATRDAKIAALEKRLAELEAGSLQYCGVYEDAKAYRKGQSVTSAGSLWIARGDCLGVRPGDGRGPWQLAVKHGRDAR